MSIEKQVRTFSEKATSVESPIEVTQKGIISFVPVSGRVFGIPTTIQDPRMLHLLPMSADSAGALGASGGIATWWCDLALYKATNAGVSAAFGSIGSNVLAAEVGRRIRLSGTVDGYNLYVAAASQTSNYGASKFSRLASTAYWRKDMRFASNAQKYLRVTICNAASAFFKTKKQTIAYEVAGYNYE